MISDPHGQLQHWFYRWDLQVRYDLQSYVGVLVLVLVSLPYNIKHLQVAVVVIWHYMN